MKHTHKPTDIFHSSKQQSVKSEENTKLYSTNIEELSLSSI